MPIKILKEKYKINVGGSLPTHGRDPIRAHQNTQSMKGRFVQYFEIWKKIDKKVVAFPVTAAAKNTIR